MRLPLASVRALPTFSGGQLTPRRIRVFVFLLVFATALAVRLLYAGPACDAAYGVDQDRYRIAHFYHQAAASLAEGDDRVAFPTGLSPDDTLLVGYPPGYFLFMAPLYRATGNAMGAVIVAQCLVDALTCALLTVLGSALFSIRAGAVAGLLMAVSPQFASLSVVLKPDTITVLPVIVALLLVVRAARSDSARGWVLAGISLGVACWLRQNALLLAPVVAAIGLVMSAQWNRTLVARSAALIAVAYAIVAPLTVRNILIYGDPIPVTIGSGFALLSGLARDDVEGRYGLSRFAFNVSTEEAEARGLPPGSFIDAYDRLQSGHTRKYEVKHTVLSVFGVDGIARDRERRDRAMGLIRGDVPYYAKVVTVRVRRLLGYTEQNRPVPVEASKGDHAYESLAFARSIGGSGSVLRHARERGAWSEIARAALAELQRLFASAVLLPLAAAGLLLAGLVDWRRAFFLAAPVLYYVGLQSLMWAEFRHTLPIHVSLFLAIGLLASCALDATWPWMRRLRTSARSLRADGTPQAGSQAAADRRT